MAANNYFGFSHGGTQYGAQPATAYAQPQAQTAYVQQTQQAAYAAPAPPRQPTYETYQTAPQAQPQYTYAAARTQVQPQAPTYDTSKTYYTPTVAAAPAAPQTVYTVAETSYQPGSYGAPQAVPVIAAKPAYQTTTYSQPQPIRQTTAIKPQHTSSHSYTNYTSNPSTTTSNNTSSHTTKLNSYDAALYSAATSYYQQQQSGTKTTTNTWQKKGTFTKTVKPKMPPKQPQLHYCEVCKISCAGPQTYREHLEGQKHKKKEVALKATTAISSGRTLQNQLRCELCDVTCTGSDAYAAHIRGAKHQKVVKLHTKLGKPIPSTEPTVMTSTSASSVSSVTKAQTTMPNTTKTSVKSATATTSSIKKVLATPKITFVGAGTLKSTGATIKEEPKTPTPVAPPKVEIKAEVMSNPDELDDLMPGEKEVTPVGFEYIEEVKNEFGKVVSFHCKLCECKFNDPNAKLMHMKGRRHRLQYKKKVDPHLAVEVKPSIKMRKIQEDKLRKQAAKEEYWRRRDMEERWRGEMKYMMMYEQPSYGYGYGQGMPVRRPDSLDDRHVMAKHATIYPNEEELQAVQSIVSSCEKALKVVSDQIADTDHPKPMETDKVTKKEEPKKKPEPKKIEPKKPDPKKPDLKAKIDPKTKKPVVEVKKEEPSKEEEKKEKDDTPPAPRVLKGVMRVGVLAKGLLLHNDLNVHLVVLCAEKPTRTLLERVASGLPKHLNATTTEEKYDVKMCVEEAAIIVSSQKDPKTSCAITMTSPVMREESNTGDGPAAPAENSTKPDPPDVLDRQKCLDALAALRHAKWFQARANGLQSCVVVIRTLRDLCQRVPTWTPLNQWAMELLVEKCVSSGGVNMSPGDALRRVFECISSGILLPGGPGLHDPCEKEPTDAAIGLTNQEREDITASAQHALRLIAFRQIHKVLGMDPLPAPEFRGGKKFNPRKRKATGGSEGGDADEGKKDKKEEDPKK